MLTYAHFIGIVNVSFVNSATLIESKESVISRTPLLKKSTSQLLNYRPISFLSFKTYKTKSVKAQ